MGFLRRHRVFALALALVVAVIVVLGTTGLAVWRAAHDDEAGHVERVDLIAVLGAAEYAGRPSPVFEGRLQHAIGLYREHFAPRVLVLGGKRPGDITTEGDAGRNWLVANGLPGSAVDAEPIGNTTLESLRAAAAFMRLHRLSSVFLVSDPWHNLRIRKMARDLGLRAYVSATWHSAAKGRWRRLSGYSRETFAYLHYRILGS